MSMRESDSSGVFSVVCGLFFSYNEIIVHNLNRAERKKLIGECDSSGVFSVVCGLCFSYNEIYFIVGEN